MKTSRIVWSSYIQLKLGHGHFKSYLKRLPDFDSDKCECNNLSSQSPAHLLFNCEKYKKVRAKLKEKFKNIHLSLKFLLITKKNIQAVLEFLNESKAARREEKI